MKEPNKGQSPILLKNRQYLLSCFFLNLVFQLNFIFIYVILRDAHPYFFLREDLDLFYLLQVTKSSFHFK